MPTTLGLLFCAAIWAARNTDWLGLVVLVYVVGLCVDAFDRWIEVDRE